MHISCFSGGGILFFTYLFLGSFRLEETNKLLSAKIYMNRLKIVYFSVGE